jgi:FixJ family two-component response regulator
MNSTIYIAVIEDDENLCRSMGRLLRAAHLQPITYPSAEEFLADTKRPKFDCLLLDVQLKGMSGLDLSRRLSAVKDATPVVFITAHDDLEVRAQAEASDCAGYFRKTSSGADVLDAIRRVIGLKDSDFAQKPGKPMPAGDPASPDSTA